MSTDLTDLFEGVEEPRQGSYKEVTGDLIKMAKEGHFDLIGHGCNCYATMGAGIAKFIKEAFPKAYDADKEWKALPLDRLGCYTVGSTETDEGGQLMVANIYSQFMPGPAIDYEALTLGLRKLAYELKENGLIESTIGLPLIGCGIAGGKWSRVSEIIKKELTEFDVTIVKLHNTKDDE